MKEETKKNIFKVLYLIKDILTVLFFGVTSIFLFKETKGRHYEIEEGDYIKLPDYDKSQQRSESNIQNEQSEFRERIRTRLNKEL